MLLVRLRFIVVLSLVYLFLMFMLYNYLWKSHTFERGLSLLDFKYHPNEQDMYDLLGDTVLFNFKRRNGFFEGSNRTNTSSNATSMEMGVTPGLAAGYSNDSTIINSNFTSRRARNKTKFDVSSLPPPSNCLHTFYYMWYGNPDFDSRYYHWNHPYLPHWKTNIAKKFPTHSHTPPDDIGASFYPQLGCYSSRDPAVIEAHVYQLRQAGIGVVSVSWYPEGMADDQGFPPDPLVPILLEIAQAYSVKVTIHIEPYKGRSPMSVRGDLKYILENYSSHPAFYKHLHVDTVTGDARQLPLIYVYDSYLNTANEWAEVLKTGKPNSIRGTELDCLMIGLLVERSHQQLIVGGGFDGFYTYFASNGFCYGSTTTNWRLLADFAKKNSLIFIPSFGPGYNDLRVRPWNTVNEKPRRDGEYFKEMAQTAVRTRVSLRGGGGGGGGGIVSLTSFNEWHEGTQIESAIPKVIGAYTYTNYEPNSPDFYLQLTREVANNMRCTL